MQVFNPMKSHVKAVVIGGGVVGCSVLYHLARAGWTDIMLIERSELTSGSSWHAAGGIHALNADPNMAALQAYTIDLLSEIEKESGQNIGLHMTGGLTLAGTPERWEWLQANYRVFQSIGIDSEGIPSIAIFPPWAMAAIMSQKAHRSLYLKYFLAPLSSSSTRTGTIGVAIN